ncbi:response regulator [Hymenobacter terricola]|uniref:response regulator n=1 Tax=Hymenobacter terricola TaxID=2819236 RepID=UPI001B3138E7|nr:response regulator [Hymenobacter terricola]
MPDKLQKIFLVDDDPYCRCLIEHAVRSHGFSDVHLFDNGAACLDALIDEPDIIFLDQTMGSVSGTDALRAIKRFNPDTYVVLVSGQRHVQVAVDSLKLGAFDYVVKDEHLTTRLVTVLDKIGAVSQLLAQRQVPQPSRLKAFFSSFSKQAPVVAPPSLSNYPIRDTTVISSRAPGSESLARTWIAEQLHPKPVHY